MRRCRERFEHREGNETPGLGAYIASLAHPRDRAGLRAGGCVGAARSWWRRRLPAARAADRVLRPFAGLPGLEPALEVRRAARLGGHRLALHDAPRAAA